MLGVIKTGPQHDKLVCQKHIKCRKLQRLFIAIAKLHIILKVSDATVLPNCSSRRDKHNTQQYSNYRTSPGRSDQEELAQKYSFPTFGDGFNINGSELKFLNTYAVDT